MREHSVKKKICLLGDAGVGKTSLIRKFVYDLFDDKYIATIGTKVTEKDLIYEFPNYKIRLKLMIWDVLGQEAFVSIRKTAYYGSSAAFLVCEVTRRKTIENIPKWIDAIGEVTGDIPMILLANKIDLITPEYQEKIGFNRDKIISLASSFSLPYFFVSAKTGKGVQAAFYAIGEVILKELFEKDIEFARKLEMFEEEPEEWQNIFKVMDQIIDTFCNLHGGQERMMPVVEAEMKNAGLDFLNPTKEGIKRFIDCLSKVPGIYDNEKEADEEKKAFLKLLSKVKD